MAINLDKYKDSLLAAWKDVLDDKSQTDWALFGYDGQSNDLKVVSKGSGGLEELVEDFNSGKMMYAFCKVNDPTTSLPKCVLINWQGEGAPIVRKGTCANHVRVVENFFKGAHVTLHARNEEEVDPQLIIDKVAKSTSSAYSFKERGEFDTGSSSRSGPVGTTYKRVIPQQEINSKERDKFWEREESEEKLRQAEERERRDLERAKLEEERKQRELAEAATREQQIQARSKNISQQREAEKQSQVTAAEQPYVDQRTEEDERKGRSEILRRQRSQEAQSVISKRTFDARAVFEQNTSAGQMHQARRSMTNQQSGSGHFPQSQTTQVQTQPPVDDQQAALPSWPPSNPEAQSPTSSPNAQNSILKNGILKSSSHVENTSYAPLSPTRETYIAENSTGNGFSNPIYVSNLVQNTESESAANLGVRSQSPYKSSSPTHTNVEAVGSSVEPKKVLFQEPDNEYEEVHHTSQNQYPEETEQQWAYADNDANGQDDLGLQARALYDYQAADATELTFDPGDIITHIDQIDEGWWQGLGPDGTFGLFPANYVELVN